MNLPILQVEDDEHDIFFLRKAFEAAQITNPVHVARDGQEAIDYLAGAGRYSDRATFPLPCLVILDLKMPKRTGMEVLKWLRQDSGLPSLAVIMFSSSAHPADIDRAYRLGANSFVVKPSGIKARAEFAKAIKDYWLRFHELSPEVIKERRKQIQVSAAP